MYDITIKKIKRKEELYKLHKTEAKIRKMKLI